MRTVSDGDVEVGVTSGEAPVGLGIAAMPLSAGQQRIWFAHGVTPVLMNLCRSYRLHGELNVDKLRAAVAAVVLRHAALRTTVHAGADGHPVAVLHSDLQARWIEHDVTDLGGTAQELRLAVLAQREYGTAFDLATEAPLRVTVIRTGSAEYVMLVVAHRIGWDDESWQVFLADLTAAYVHGGISEPLSSAPKQGGPGDAAVDYWREELSNPAEPLELPGPNGAVVPTDWKAARCTAHLSVSVMEQVERLARDSGSTPHAVLLAAYSVLLHRYTHANDFIVASPVPALDPHARGRIGHFGNVLPLRMRPRADESFKDLLARVRRTTLDGMAHQGVSLDRVVPRVGFSMATDSAELFCPPGIRCEKRHSKAMWHMFHSV